MRQRMIFLLKMPLGRRKQENMRIPPVHTMTFQSTMGNPMMKSFSLMPPANSIFAKSHLPLITHRQLLGPNLLPLFLVQSWSQATEACLVLAYVKVGSVPLFMVHREMEMLIDLPQWLAWTSPGEAAGQQGGHVELHVVIRVIERESTQLGYSQQMLWEEMVNQRHSYFSDSSGKRNCLLKAILTFILLQFLLLLCPQNRVTLSYSSSDFCTILCTRSGCLSEASPVF